MQEEFTSGGLNAMSELLEAELMAGKKAMLYAHTLTDMQLAERMQGLAGSHAERFNALYGDVFVMPEAYIPKVGARVMSLQEPTRKMSKSDPNPNGYISILDDADTIRRKVKRAVTDSDGEIRLSPDKPGVSNLLAIYAACRGVTPEQAEAEFAGMGYGALKDGVSEAVIAELAPLQEKYRAIRGDKGYLEGILRENAEIASRAATKTLRKVHKKVGFLAR